MSVGLSWRLSHCSFLPTSPGPILLVHSPCQAITISEDCMTVLGNIMLLICRVSPYARRMALCAWSSKATEISCCAPLPTSVGHSTESMAILNDTPGPCVHQHASRAGTTRPWWHCTGHQHAQPYLTRRPTGQRQQGHPDPYTLSMQTVLARCHSVTLLSHLL